MSKQLGAEGKRQRDEMTSGQQSVWENGGEGELSQRPQGGEGSSSDSELEVLWESMESTPDATSLLTCKTEPGECPASKAVEEPKPDDQLATPWHCWAEGCGPFADPRKKLTKRVAAEAPPHRKRLRKSVPGSKERPTSSCSERGRPRGSCKKDPPKAVKKDNVESKKQVEKENRPVRQYTNVKKGVRVGLRSDPSSHQLNVSGSQTSRSATPEITAFTMEQSEFDALPNQASSHASVPETSTPDTDDEDLPLQECVRQTRDVTVALTLPVAAVELATLPDNIEEIAIQASSTEELATLPVSAIELATLPHDAVELEALPDEEILADNSVEQENVVDFAKFETLEEEIAENVATLQSQLLAAKQKDRTALICLGEIQVKLKDSEKTILDLKDELETAQASQRQAKLKIENLEESENKLIVELNKLQCVKSREEMLKVTVKTLESSVSDLQANIEKQKKVHKKKMDALQTEVAELKKWKAAREKRDQKLATELATVTAKLQQPK